MTVVYCAGLYLRWITGQLFGDSWWLLALADTFALYLYAPLLVLAPIALLTRRRSALLAVFAGATLFFAQYGALLIPIPLRAQSAGINALRVMTFNIPFPYYGSDEQALIDHILAQNADVVFTQELTPRGVDALLRGLRPTYPYIASELSGLPHEGKLVFSKYPLRPDQVIEETTRGRTSQVVIATIDGQEVVLVNMHPT